MYLVLDQVRKRIVFVLIQSRKLMIFLIFDTLLHI